jgi:hypothetical protein
VYKRSFTMVGSLPFILQSATIKLSTEGLPDNCKLALRSARKHSVGLPKTERVFR